MPVDNGTPLISWAQMTSGAFANLVREFTDVTAQNAVLLEATRELEGMCARRLAPFTITESHRAEGIDPDELNGDASVPMDIRSTVSMSYAMSLGGNSNLARQVWLNEYAVRYPEFWQYSNVSVNVVRSYGGTQANVTLLDGPAPDSGRVWFLLGSFIPVGSQIYVTYSGEYTTIPADLTRAMKYMVAAYVVDELDPMGDHGHDPDLLRLKASDIVVNYMRE